MRSVVALACGVVAVMLLSSASLVTAEGDPAVLRCQACKTALTSIQEKAAGKMTAASWKKATAYVQRSTLEESVPATCNEFTGWATVGDGSDIKYHRFSGGKIGGGMTLTNLNMGPHVNEQLKAACLKLVETSDSFIIDELLTAKRVYDANLSSACDAACSVEGGDDEERVEL